MIYNTHYQLGVDYEDFNIPLDERRDPSYTPRPQQRNLDNELKNMDPVQQSELAGLRADAQRPLDQVIPTEAWPTNTSSHTTDDVIGADPVP